MRIVSVLVLPWIVAILLSATSLADPPATGSPKDARPALTEPATKWQDLLVDARSLGRTDPQKAIALCDRAIALAPTQSEPWMLRGVIHDSRRDYSAAARDVSEAIRLDPAAAEAWQWRGVLHFKLSRFRESVVDFDRYLALVPSQRAVHWQRGISLYYAGDFAAGRKQFELHQTVNPNDVENAAWHFLCLARSEGVTRARALLLTPGPDARVPMREILALFAGQGSADEVLAAANQHPNRGDALFYAHLYLGLFYEVLPDKARAVEHIGKAAAIAPAHYMGDVARVHARLLQERALIK